MHSLRVLLCLLFVGCFSSVALASNASLAEDQAGKFIDKLARDVLGTISNEKLGKPQKQSRLEKLFAQNIDIPWVGRFVLGVNWRQIDAAKQKRYLKAYEDFVLTHYASRFSEYTSGDFTITESTATGDDEFMVSMEIAATKKNDPPVLLDYKLRKDKGGFKVYDVVIEGVSMISTQRSEFASVISSRGIDGLIEQLESRSLVIGDKK